MTLLKLSPMTIVLSLMPTLSLMDSLSQPRGLTLDTGYPYETGENPTTAEQYRDLKCAYLMASVTHTRLVKLILEDHTISISVAVGVINNFDIRAVICTLYDVDDVDIGSLWLLLLYSSTMPSYYERRVANEVDKAKRVEAVDGLVSVHYYLTVAMQRELSAANCRSGNRFGWYNEQYERRIAAMPIGQLKLYHLQTAGFNNCNHLHRLLKANDVQCTYGSRRYEALRSRNLFVNNLGGKLHLKLKLMNAYDVQVRWDGALNVLENNYENARRMYSSSDRRLPLLSIMTYYSGVFSLLKVIMCRLMWKCLLYVDTSQRYQGHLAKCRDFLMEFQRLLHLYDDQDVLDLVDRLSGSVVVVDDVITQIRLNLQKINDVLQCVATNELTLELQQISSRHLTPSSFADDVVATAQDFIKFISSTFQNVDFDVIRSIVKYVNSNYMLNYDTV